MAGNLGARRTIRTVLTLLLCALALSGCVLRDLEDLAERIEPAGYSEVTADHSVYNGVSTLTVEANTDTSRQTEVADAREIAKIVWDSYPRDFDELIVEINGQTAEVLTSDELESMFGPRPPGVVKRDNTVLITVISVSAAFLLLVGVIVLIARAVVRRPRPHAAPYATYGPHPVYPPPTAYPPAYPPGAAFHQDPQDRR